MDLVIRTERFPQPGETLLGGSFASYPGGKGANQAIAAARFGCDVSMIGAVGEDDHASAMLHALNEDQIDLTGITFESDAATGCSLVSVNTTTGDNTILVAPGANAVLSVEDVQMHRQLIEQADALLMQLETTMQAITCAARIAHEAGKPVFLNAAPAQRLPDDLIPLIDELIVNETEAAILAGLDVTESCCDTEESIRHLLEAVRSIGCQTVVITLGKKGAAFYNGTDFYSTKPPPVKPVDTTGAGDAFSAVYTVCRINGESPESSLQQGCAAGALATTIRGAIPSLPNHEQVMGVMKSSPCLTEP